MEIHIADTVRSPEVNRNYLLYHDNTQRELYLGYNYTYDKRDFKGYPLKGYLVKAGIEGSQFLSSAGHQQTFTLRSSISRYFRIGGPFFGSFNTTARYYSLNTPPYSKVRALGYGKDYIRGYELKVIDGNHFVLGKAEVKCRFLNKKYNFMKQLRNYEVLPVSLFLTTYFDMGYVNQEPDPDNVSSHNNLPNSWQHGSGVGLNIVLFYDYCFRAEYSFDKYLNNRMYFSFVASM
jgi:outer membrane protein assembly factor BamA